MDEAADGTRAHYLNLKEEYSAQAERNRSAFAHLDEARRQELEGYRAGLYVRLRFDDVPMEIVQHFDPAQMYIVGALLPAEQTVGVVQVGFDVD